MRAGKSHKEASDANDRMLEADAAAPRDRDALVDRLRDGTFRPTVVSPPVAAHNSAFEARLADEIQRVPPGAALEQAMPHFQRMRSRQKFAAFHGSIYDCFNQERTLISHRNSKDRSTAALTTWRQLCAA